MRWRVAMLTMLLAAGGATLTACSSIGGFTGAVAGIASGTATSNPSIGIAIGITVRAATDDVMNRIYRSMQAGEQDEIARIAGDLKTGERRPWFITHRIPFSDEHGELEVVGESTNALTQCREVLFSVAKDQREVTTSRWFMTTTCRQPDGRWRWAAAEPAVKRWGSLH